MPDTPVEAANWRLQLCRVPQVISPAGQGFALERRDAAMLALLAIDGAVARSRVAAMLWPDEALEQVRGRLRQRLYALKTRLGVEAVAGKATLGLTQWLHWPGFEHEAPDGPLLGDEDYADLPAFADWLAAARERLQALRREALASEASALEQQGRLAEAIVSAERLLALEPLQEHAHRRLMRLHYLRGDRAAALLAFDRCERALKDEVGAAPSVETLDLLAQIDRSQSLQAAAVRRVVPAAVLRPPRLVGRDAEWAMLQAAWERGDAVVIVGEAGMGKTRLMTDLLRANAPVQGKALQVSARPGDERVPYAVLVRLLRGLLAARTVPPAESIAAELARVLPELPQRAVAATGDAVARTRFAGAIESLTRDAVSTGIATLAVDDLHFADAASVEMIEHLAGTPGIRWLTAFRGAEIGPPGQELVDTWVGRLGARPVVLQPLTREQVGELVVSLGVPSLGSAALTDALHQRTGGNPLFLLETVKALWQQGEPAPGGLGAASVAARLPTSASAARLIERRIGQLSREAVRLARCAAVAGQDFSAGLAARVLDVNPLDLADAWTELESAQVMRDGAFAHDLIFEAALASVPGPIAQALHRRIAELMSSEGAEPARLAAHWLGAGEALRAAPHLAEAGRRALRAMRMREGIACLGQAQSIYGRAGDADAQCALIDEMVLPAIMASSFDEVRGLLEEAARSAITDRQRSMTLRALALMVTHRSDFARAVELAREALAAALAARDRACELAARALLAELLGELCQAAEADAMLRPIEGWVNRQGTDAQRLQYADALAKVLKERGKLTESLAQWQRAIDIARGMDAPHVLPNLLMLRASTASMEGRLEAARAAMVEGRELLQDVASDAMILRPFTIRLQVMDRMLGHYASSLAFGESVLADPATGPAEADEVRLAFAFAYRDLGQAARVRQLAATPRATLNTFNGMFWHEALVSLPLAVADHEALVKAALAAAADAMTQWSGRSLLPVWRLQARHGDGEAAIDAARAGLAFTSASGMRGHQLVFQALLAQHLARLGESAQALRLAREVWPMMATFNTGLVYRGAIWRALVEALQPHDPPLVQAIVQAAAAWIHRTAADHVPPAFRKSFLELNPDNAQLLALASRGVDRPYSSGT